MSRRLSAVIVTAALAPACTMHPSEPLAPDATAGPVDGRGPGGGPDGRPPRPTLDDLLARIARCERPIGGPFATDHGGASEVAICGLAGAVAWQADLDVDCDGQESAVCNAVTDPWWQNRTSATTSTGAWLDAATLPYVVLPLPSARWRYAESGLDLGSVVAVLYQGQLEFGVFGDQGPDAIIGEASYRMAELLGIDPHPTTGGADGGATFIAFPGVGGRVTVMEDHGQAVQIGHQRLDELLEASQP